MRIAGILAAGVLCLVAASASAEPIVIKFSHVVASDTPKGQAAERFKELADKYTNGQVKVEVYPNSQLYKDKEELEALQLGAVQMLAPSLAKFGPLGAKEFEVFDFPCLFPDTAGLHKITQGPIGKEPARQARVQGHPRPRLLGQRLQDLQRQQAAEAAGGLQGPEDAHPVLEGARRADARARRDPAGDGVLRGLPGAADRASSTAPRTRRRTCTPRRCSRCRSTPSSPTTAISATR